VPSRVFDPAVLGHSFVPHLADEVGELQRQSLVKQPPMS
jgi:hypothetical protein